MPTCPTCRTRYADDVAHCPGDGDALLPDEAFLSADADLAPGTMVGEYRVEGKLGEGGFGAVYRAVHPVIGKAAAVKVLSRQWSSNPQMVSRFIAEARAVNQIRHKNIIDIFAFGALADGRQYYVMELLDGMPFDRYLHEQGRLPPETALPILRAVARALDAAHAQGIVHRDLKPENVFLVFDDDGTIQPKLLDFGIAKLLGEGMSGHKTRTGTPLGTPNYMSPEQCNGVPVDARTDVYSLGVMAHEVLTGKLPFDGESVMSILVKHMSAPPPRMSAECPELPPALDAPVLHMLEKDPAQRPPSAGAAIDALGAAAASAGIAVGAVATGVSGPMPNVRSAPFAARRSGVAAASDGAAELGRAKTVVASDASGRTFMPAESDVAARPRGRMVLVAAVAVLGVAAGAAAVVVAGQHREPGGGAIAGSSPSVSAVAAAGTPTPGAPSAGASIVLSPAQATAPARVAVTIESTPPHAAVWLGPKKLGDAPGPLMLPRGDQKVTLAIRADGYAPATVDVLPAKDVEVAVKLEKPAPAARAAGASTHVSKDLENPF